MEDEFEQSRKDIKEIYDDLKKITEMNEKLWIMPVELYNRILRKLDHIEDRIKKQTESLKRHLKEKQELKRKLKKS